MGKGKILLILLWVVLLVLSFSVDNNASVFAESLKNPFLDGFMSWITYFGNVFVVLIVITSLFLWEEKKREWIPTLWSSFIASIGVGLVLKWIIARPRPMTELVYAITALNYSFPSTHATAAFAALPILDKEFPKFKWFWILFAVLVAVSRVYIGVHYLSDVIAGALLGYLIGYLFVYIEEKYKLFRKVRG
jgi:undecaprenyl-diphosphatase